MARAGRVSLLGLATLLLLAVATSALAADDYTLGPGDLVSVIVYGHPELSRDVTVLDDGTISYDIAGQIKAQGLTLQQLADAIAQGLKTELREPQVTAAVKVPRPQQVRVGGAVKQPGNYDIRIAGRVVEAITAAGDLSVPVEHCRAAVLRGKETIPVDLASALRLEPEANLTLQPDDVLYVADTRISVAVNGQVAHPGRYLLAESAGIRDAVAAAGGTLERADLLRSYIVRGQENIEVNIFSILEQGAEDLSLQPGDVLQVPESRARIAVFGYVNKPGWHDIRETDNLTIVDAIAQAGDLSREYRDIRVAVMRFEEGQPKEIPVDFIKLKDQADLTQNIPIKPGDIVVVQGRKSKTTMEKYGIVYPIYLLSAIFGL